MNKRLAICWMTTLLCVLLTACASTRQPETDEVPHSYEINAPGGQADVRQVHVPRDAPYMYEINAPGESPIVGVVKEIGESLASVAQAPRALAAAAGAASARLEACRLASLHSAQDREFIADVKSLVDNVRLRATLVADISDAFDALLSADSTADANTLIDASRRCISVCDKMRAAPHLFSGWEWEWIRERRKTAERVLIHAQVEDAYTRLARLCQEADTPDKAVEACEKAARVIDTALARVDLFKTETLAGLHRIKSKFQAEGIKIRAEFDGLLREALALLERERSQFVNNCAAEDVRVASNLLQAENAKWFNLGSWRSDAEKLYHARKLSERVMASQASYHLREAAARIASGVDAHLWDKEKSVCAARPAVPSYISLPGWPSWSPNAKALDEWRRRHAQRQPLDIDHSGNRSQAQELHRPAL